MNFSHPVTIFNTSKIDVLKSEMISFKVKTEFITNHLMKMLSQANPVTISHPVTLKNRCVKI
jgi:hypothetical protein